jgi:hypothetical protein
MLGYITCSDTKKPKDIEWLYRLPEYDGITVFTDRYCHSPLIDSPNLKKKVFWLLEPPAIRSETYSYIRENYDKFDYILTYDSDLLDLDDKFKKYIVGQCRILEEDQEIYPKSKMISMIASNKTSTEGHNLRHQVAKLYSDKFKIDLFGSGYSPFDYKLNSLKPYMFSIAIMNSKMNNFFTEVLVDLLKTGTVPIFWGASNIGDYFNTDGFIIFNSMEELESILSNLNESEYTKRLNAMQENFELADKYLSTDDYISGVLSSL